MHAVGTGNCQNDGRRISLESGPKWCESLHTFEMPIRNAPARTVVGMPLTRVVDNDRIERKLKLYRDTASLVVGKPPVHRF
eukprot:1244366-Amphidinium_carterae.1